MECAHVLAGPAAFGLGRRRESHRYRLHALVRCECQSRAGQSRPAECRGGIRAPRRDQGLRDEGAGGALLGAACTVPPVSQPPVIGIVCAVLRAQWGPWDQPAAVVAADYSLQVQRAGAVAVVIPPDPAGPGALLDRIDALMLTGGSDLEACAYGQEPHAAAEDPDRLRDAYEVVLVREALRRGMPLLGICRGMQVMNVALGGDLRQHLPEHLGADTHRRTTGTFAGNEHLVALTPGSLAARAAGETTHRVPSHHHQAIDRLGDGLMVTGVAVDDGIPEAIEVPGRRFVLGVQWHPEADPSSPVIAALVDAARDR